MGALLWQGYYCTANSTTYVNTPCNAGYWGPAGQTNATCSGLCALVPVGLASRCLHASGEQLTCAPPAPLHAGLPHSDPQRHSNPLCNQHAESFPEHHADRHADWVSDCHPFQHAERLADDHADRHGHELGYFHPLQHAERLSNGIPIQHV